MKTGKDDIAKIAKLSDEEVADIAKIIKIIDLARLTRKSKKKLYISLSSFPSEISRYRIAELLEMLEDDFNIIDFLGFTPGDREEVADMTYCGDEKFSNFRTLILERMRKIKPRILSLRSSIISFDDVTATIIVDKIKCQFEPYSYEHLIIKAMFDTAIGIPVSWDELYEKIIGEEPSSNEKNKKMIRDTVNRVNDKISACFGNQDKLFSQKNTNIIRNY
jgi:hypothetical protein